MADVPAPTLDERNVDQLIAQCIASLPAELSNRSDGSVPVAIIEALGPIAEKILFAINNWPRSPLQKLLSLVGVQLLSAEQATCTQSFTLSNPVISDLVIASGSQVSTTDGATVYATTADLVIPAYTAPAGTIALAAGSPTVTGTGTSFPTDGSWNGYQIRVPTSSNTWYTISSVSTSTSLTLTTNAASTVATAAFNVGPVTGTVGVQCTVAGAAGNVGSGKLTTAVTSITGLASTTNTTASTDGDDQETAAEAVERAPSAFATREIACSQEDYATFAERTLGDGGRARFRSNYNITTAEDGTVTGALLSPNWTTTTTVSAQERANVTKDLNGRGFVGATIVDVPVTLIMYDGTVTSQLFGCAVYRKANYSDAQVKVNIASAINAYLNPANYPWDPDAYSDGFRPIYVPDLVDLIESAEGVDRIEEKNGVPACGMDYRTSAASMTFAASTAVTSVGATDYANATAGQTYLIDSTNLQAYLITVKSGGNAFTIDRAWAGTTGAISSVPYFTAADVGSTKFTNWTYLPFSNLSVSLLSPAASIFIVGAV